MRLIDVHTLELKEFFSNIPPYAILSHTWGNEEVTFQEYLLATSPQLHSHSHSQAQAQEIKRKAGFSKILGACSRAKQDRLQYLWCDTNCIDKRSSAELSEAINSMYAWYRDSVVCYAYLADVDHNDNGSFAKSRWFTRGWTLQELLAPSKIVFFDMRWVFLGDRKELASVICEVARIHIGALHDRNTVSEYSIAQRMSWAADRQTSRQEDIAYSLLGIFDINMPLLYGEGSKAFSRLQKEIMKVSNDHSILAWDAFGQERSQWMGVLAPSSASFRLSGSIIRDPGLRCNPFSVTNLGISIKLTVTETAEQGIWLAGLKCAKEVRERLPSASKDNNNRSLCRVFQVWIPLYSFGNNQNVRIHQPCSKLFLEASYIFRGKQESRNLLLSVDPVADGFCVDLERNKLEHPFGRLATLTSGFLVIASSGILSSIGLTFSKVYPLGNFHMVSLKNREKLAVSHEILCHGSFAILLSAMWDEHHTPTHWCSSTILYKDLQALAQVVAQSAWACLFGTRLHTPSGSCCNTASKMFALHDLIQSRYSNAIRQPVTSSMTPTVHFEAGDFYDLFQQSELIVHIIFRERPGS